MLILFVCDEKKTKDRRQCGGLGRGSIYPTVSARRRRWSVGLANSTVPQSDSPTVRQQMQSHIATATTIHRRNNIIEDIHLANRRHSSAMHGRFCKNHCLLYLWHDYRRKRFSATNDNAMSIGHRCSRRRLQLWWCLRLGRGSPI